MIGDGWIVVRGGGEGQQQEIPPDSSSNLARLELKLLGLEVGCRVEVERASLCGFRDQTRILVNLIEQRDEEKYFRVMRMEWKAGHVSDSSSKKIKIRFNKTPHRDTHVVP